jgi:hypothetical protein
MDIEPISSGSSFNPPTGQHGYIDVGGHFRGARTDDELAQAVFHRKNDVVRNRTTSAWPVQPACKDL